MILSKELSTLYKCRDYAIWKMESFRGSSKYTTATNVVEHYNKEIEKLSKKKKILKQLSLF